MASRRRIAEDEASRRKPATTPEAREQQLAALAYDLAEQQLREGSASSQVITQAMRYGSTREELEKERLAHENEMLKVKMEAIQAQQRIEELYVDAIHAMRAYSGNEPMQDEDDVEE